MYQTGDTVQIVLPKSPFHERKGMVMEVIVPIDERPWFVVSFFAKKHSRCRFRFHELVKAEPV